ncbi:serine hydrolase domain-containing protein [Massilia sp. SR12]
MKMRASVYVIAAMLYGFALSAVAGTIEEANSQARQTIQAIMKEQRIPGLQLAVIKDDRIVLSESYGMANVENKVPATRTIRFPLNSATKAFTGVAMMQLAEAGQVDLDTPVSRYLDDLPPAWRDIRVRQLLAHTSGLPDIVNQQGDVEGGSEASAWKVARARPVAAPPGQQFDYNQTNYALLAQIISKQSRMPYERFITERQFAVARMPLSTFGDSYDLVPNAATIYAYAPRGTSAPDDGTRLSRWIYAIPYGLWAGGGIQTTADEVAHWLIALSKGRLVSQASLQRMWTPEKLNSGANGEWGAGWPVLRTTPELQVASIGGARAAFIVYPEQRLAVVVLTNLAGAHPQRFIPRIADFYKSAPGQATAATAPCVKMRSGAGSVCMKFSAPAIARAEQYGLHLADPFSVVKHKLAQQGWVIDRAYLSEDAPQASAAEEMVCGRGWDAVCSTAFKLGNETLYLSMSGTNDGTPLISVETGRQ